MLAYEAAFVTTTTITVVTAFQSAIATFGGARGAQAAFQADIVCTTIVAGGVFSARVARQREKLGGEETHAHRFAGARGETAAFNGAIAPWL